MNIIDVNCFVGYDISEIRPKVTPEEVLARLDAGGVQQCVAYHSRTVIQIEEGNAEMEAVKAQYPDRFRTCYGIHPYMDGIQQLKPEDMKKFLSEKRPDAVVLFPSKQNYVLSSYYCDEMLQLLDDMRMPTLLHLSPDNYKKGVTYYLPEIVEKYPNIPFILVDADHTHSLIVRTFLRKTKNVYISVGYMCGAGELDQLVNEFGGERFVFGSSEGCSPSGGLALVYQGRFSQEDKEMIFHGTWDKLQEGIKWL